MDKKPCVKVAECDLMSQLSLSIPTGCVTVKTGAQGDDLILIVQLTSPEYKILVPETYKGYAVTTELVGAVKPYKKSDFFCGGPDED